jgi:hypothetical protein
MNNDAFCVFIIFACMLTLVMPGQGQIILAMFSFALSLTALSAVDIDGSKHPGPDNRDGHHDRHAAGR